MTKNIDILNAAVGLICTCQARKVQKFIAPAIFTCQGRKKIKQLFDNSLKARQGSLSLLHFWLTRPMACYRPAVYS